MNQCRSHSGEGFSFRKLLIAILIVSLLIALGAAGLRGMGAGKRVSSATVIAEALFDEARSTARVGIDINDPNDGDHHLKRMFIAYKEISKDSPQAVPTPR